jgi:prevent-host-death family protein
MEVSVSKLRAELKDWIEAARRGEEVVVTDRGVPVARLSAIDSADLMTRLQSEGLITPPSADRPGAEHAPREHREAVDKNPLSGLARRLRR